jgi:hypothetical protein
MKICIATPMYGGNSKSVYVAGVTDLTQKLTNSGHQIYHISLTNESLITRARNTLAHMFVKSDSDALLFIDGDHGFNSDDILKMVNSGKDLIGAPYPMKSIHWENVRKAALAGKENLETYSGNFAVNFLKDNISFRGDEPFPVRDIGTGMMFIHRRVFDALKPICKKYKNNALGNDIAMGEEITEYFLTFITPEPESILLSEDYAFCDMWRSLGNTVYAAPWVRISHAGEYNFAGHLLATLEIQNQVSNSDEANAQPVRASSSPSSGTKPRRSAKK